MRILTSKEYKYYLIRLLSTKFGEIAYLKLGLTGLKFEIEFPSDWHERRMGWVRTGFGFFGFSFAFPWKWVVPDNYQCSGPTYGFTFYDDSITVYYGKSNGKMNDPHKSFQMPWGWRFKERKKLTEPECHAYTYVLKSGKVQKRIATIYEETRTWTRPWFPHKMVRKTIDIEFNDEVGERSGSWKGGCTGCGYDMLPGETGLQTLRRMEAEREF